MSKRNGYFTYPIVSGKHTHTTHGEDRDGLSEWEGGEERKKGEMFRDSLDRVETV